MRQSSSTTPAELEPYTGCPHCTPYVEYIASLRRLRPLPPDAVLAIDPDGVDWNEYYWGYRGSNRSERRTIVRPLPRFITDRIPLELFEYILGFLRWETKDLYNCALVCQAWHHHSQRLLYSRVVIDNRAAYAVVRASLQNRKSTQYLRLACASMLDIDLFSEQHTGHCLPVSPVPWRSLPCLRINCLTQGPRHFLTLQFSSFSALIHLELYFFRLHSFTDLCHIICGLRHLRELTLRKGHLVSRAAATNRAAGFLPVKAPHLSKVSLRYLKSDLVSKLALWIASTEICHSCTDLILTSGDISDDGSCNEILRKLGPSLASFIYTLEYPQSWQHLGALAFCTRLSTVSLTVKVNPMDSWQGLVTTLHKILSHFFSPVIRTLQVETRMQAPKDSPITGPSTSAHLDSEFWTIDLGSIHDLIKRPLFDLVQDARIVVSSYITIPTPLTCDAVLTAEEMERRVRLILEPWDRCGILTVEGYNEATDEEIRRERAKYGRNSEQGGSSEGVSGEEAQSSEDVIVLASEQENEVGFEGTVQDLVGSSEG